MKATDASMRGAMVELLAGLGGAGVEGGRAEAGYAQLRRLVQSTLRSQGIGPSRDADDFVNDLVLGLLEAKKAGRAEAPWRALSADDVNAVVRRKTHRLACEKRPGWNGYRALRTHLRAALRSGLGRRPPCEPLSLYDGDVLSARHVAAAAAWLVWEHQVPRELEALTVALKPRLRGTFAAHFDTTQGTSVDTAPDAAPVPEVSVDRDRETRRLLRQVQAALGTQATRLYGRRLSGWTLASLGEAEGLGLTTVHDRLRKTEATVGGLIRASDCTPETAALVLELLATEARR